MMKKEQLMELNKEDLIKIIDEQAIEIEKLNGTMGLIIKQNILIKDKLPKDPQTGDPAFYDQQWHYVDKLVYLLKLANRPLVSSEILELLLTYDEYARYWRDRVKSLSVHLNKALKYQRIVANKIPGKNGLVYFLPE